MASLKKIKLGHAVLAEFESKLSKVEIDSFASILESEENNGTSTALGNLSEFQKLQYSLWRSLVKSYFGNISSKSIENNYKKPSSSNNRIIRSKW